MVKSVQYAMNKEKRFQQDARTIEIKVPGYGVPSIAKLTYRSRLMLDTTIYFTVFRGSTTPMELKISDVKTNMMGRQ